jgi:adenylate kinase family enzyme
VEIKDKYSTITDMQEYTIILIGKSGSGKGTQIKKLCEVLESRGENSIQHLESGQNLRDFINAETYTSKLAKSNNVQGKLQPAFLAIWAWVNQMIETFTGQKIVFIDGAPRKLNEAYILDEMFDFYNRHNRYIIHINITDEWARERLKDRARGDDLKEESVARRLDWFQNNSPEILSFFEKSGKYKGVHKDIITGLQI